MDKTNDPVRRYHERTKHHFNRYARSSGSMDWANQPDPFRTYRGARQIRLPLLPRDPMLSHGALYTPEPMAPAPLSLAAVGGFMELSMGLSAWKAYGPNRWSLRINPSSGNLHPTETHLILPPLEGAPSGIYHYHPLNHALEQRTELPPELWQELFPLPGKSGFLVALSTIFWRESWKYGERAFRYCQLDAGHAAAALRYAAALFGWRVACLTALSDRQTETLLGFDKTPWHPQEAEHPDMVCHVATARGQEGIRSLPEGVIARFAALDFSGEPDPLSRKRIDWEIIGETAAATRKPATAWKPHPLPSSAAFPGPGDDTSAAGMIRRRRSAVAFHRDSTMEKTAFIALLDKTLPRRDVPPFDISLSPPRVHLLIFVHRVAGIAPGLYLWCRCPEQMEDLRRQMKREFLWERIDGQAPLFLLEPGDYRFTAMELCCHQEIAGFGAFSLGMIADFARTLDAGAYGYRQLYWECGMIGQVLYLEAEAADMRGTGIGCFFDDPVHDRAGLAGDAYQSLYHFTVGRPVADPRLSTYPPYAHLKRGSGSEFH